jgi:flagellar hook-length control protein FliK
VQAKPDANKADGASPFALMVDTVTSKDAVRDSGRPPQKDKSNTADADDKSAKAQDNKSQDSQGAQPSAPANSSARPEKSGKSASKDETKAGDDKDKDQQVSAADSQTLDQQVSAEAVMPENPQNVPAPPPVAAVPADGESDDLAVDTAAAVAPKAQADIKAAGNGKPEAKAGPKADMRAGTPAKEPVKPAATTETPALPDDSGEETTDTQIAELVGQAAPATAKTAAPEQTAVAANIQAATNDKGKAVQNGAAQTIDAASRDTAQAPKDAAPKDVAPDSAAPKGIATKNDITEAAADNAGKAGSPKPTSPKSHAGQPDTADKADAARSDAPQSDTSKTAAQDGVPNAAPTPKAEPHPSAQAIFAINSIAAPQAAQSSPVATAIANANAHVQVSAQAEPNLPALAVEIAGRSKAGAKQFDIRLDPPELGRVEVRLSIDATGKASAHLSADQPQTLSLLQKDAPVLTRALREAGLDVSQDGLNFSLRQQGENASGNAGNNGRRGSSRSFPLSASINVDAAAGSAAYRAAANGRLDIRV